MREIEQTVVETPQGKLGNKGKDLEDPIKVRCDWMRAQGICSIKKQPRIAVPTGTKFNKRTQRKEIEYRATKSAVDFVGTMPWNGLGLMVRFDAKITSSASFSLSDDYLKEGQKAELLEHAKLGACCFLLIHFNARSGATFTKDAKTYAFPVHPLHPFWVEVQAGRIRSINPETCNFLGVKVDWTTRKKTRTARPDIVKCVSDLMETPIPDVLPSEIAPGAPPF